MRAVFALPFILPLPVLADDIAVDSRVAAATVFPQGAALTREATFSAPAGQHRLILSDMPVRDAAGIRIEAQGVTIGSVTIRDDLTPPRDEQTRAAIEAAEAEVERLEQAVEEARDAAQEIRLEAEGARARIAFLKGLGNADGLGAAEVDRLRALALMVGEETLAAERQAQDAEIRAREAEQDTKDLLEELADARQALAALDVETERRAYLAVSVDVPEAVDGALTIRYVTAAARWRPVYDIHLDRGAPALTIGRGAYVAQSTGESWEDVALTLSTVRPAGKTQPGELYPVRRWIDDPAPEPRMRQDFAGAVAESAEGPRAEPAPMMKMADARFDGLNVTYDYPDPVDVATGADELRIALGTLDLTPEITARAVPRLDDTAFLMAEVTNAGEELLLPTDQSEFYLDGTFVGLRPTELIAAGDEASFSFGPIEGLRLTRTVLDRSEGDRGVITRANQRVEAVEIEIDNLTGEDWDLRLLDQVPYSEQDDLEIDWSATPEPDETDVDGKRGILAWDLDIAAGETRTLRLTHTLTWPTDKVLR